MATASVLQPRTVSVWRIPLAQAMAVVTAHRAVLSDDERQKADRYRFDAPRRRFVLTRAALRHLLAGILAQSPADLAFAYGPRGKPYLPAAPWLHFNVSHSHDEALCAITLQGAVGIDVEHIRPLRDADAIARAKFAPEEYALWAALPASRQLPAFFACWSRKEAFIKATGEGLARPLDDFIVTLLPDDPVRLVSIRSEPAEAAHWTLLGVPVPEGYAGALLVRGPEPAVVMGEWNPAGPFTET